MVFPLLVLWQRNCEESDEKKKHSIMTKRSDSFRLKTTTRYLKIWLWMYGLLMHVGILLFIKVLNDLISFIFLPVYLLQFFTDKFRIYWYRYILCIGHNKCAYTVHIIHHAYLLTIICIEYRYFCLSLLPPTSKTTNIYQQFPLIVFRPWRSLVRRVEKGERPRKL